jgi:hypothetical protein
MIGRFLRRIPRYTVRISPHTKKLQVVRVMRLDAVPGNHEYEKRTDDYDINQLGYWEDEGDE